MHAGFSSIRTPSMLSSAMKTRCLRLLSLIVLLAPWLLGPRAGGVEEPPARATVLHLIREQLRAWETGDEGVLLATLHPDVVFAFPGKRLDHAALLANFRGWKGRFRDTRTRIFRVVIDGAQFAVEYTFASTNVETGKRAAGGTVVVGEVRDGKLKVWKEYLDGRVSRLQASGELPVDETAEPFPWPDTPESRRP